MKPFDSPTHTYINGHSPIEDLTAITRGANSPIADDQRQHLATFAGTVHTSLSPLHDFYDPVPDPLPQLQRVSPPLQMDITDNPDDQAYPTRWGPVQTVDTITCPHPCSHCS